MSLDGKASKRDALQAMVSPESCVKEEGTAVF